MNTIYIPANKPEDWKALLAEPDEHWKAGYSAMSLAQCWMEAEGFPQSVRKALSGGARPSQNDLFVLAKGGGEFMVIMVEGKVAEPFGPTVGEWFGDCREFAALYGVAASTGNVNFVKTIEGKALYLGGVKEE